MHFVTLLFSSFLSMMIIYIFSFFVVFLCSVILVLLELRKGRLVS